VIVAQTELGRGVLGVVDGASPLGVEADADIACVQHVGGVLAGVGPVEPRECLHSLDASKTPVMLPTTLGSYTIQTKVKSSEIERKTFSKSVGGRGKDAPARKGANNDHQRIPMISTGI